VVQFTVSKKKDDSFVETISFFNYNRTEIKFDQPIMSIYKYDLNYYYLTNERLLLNSDGKTIATGHYWFTTYNHKNKERK
jgi:hypothetical protein